jgi:hypothetical protein
VVETESGQEFFALASRVRIDSRSDRQRRRDARLLPVLRFEIDGVQIPNLVENATVGRPESGADRSLGSGEHVVDGLAARASNPTRRVISGGLTGRWTRPEPGLDARLGRCSDRSTRVDDDGRKQAGAGPYTGRAGGLVVAPGLVRRRQRAGQGTTSSSGPARPSGGLVADRVVRTDAAFDDRLVEA